MSGFGEWWETLTTIHQWLYIAAAFFSTIFLFQLIMSLLGLGGGGDIDAGVGDVHVHHAPEDPSSTVIAFKLLSTQSLSAFFTLFSWGGALYMSNGHSALVATSLGAIWGIAAMFVVAWLYFMMGKLGHSGNANINTTVGAYGTLHLDIPDGGEGEVRIMCSGVMTHLKARCSGGAIKAGTPVKVSKVLGPNTVEVVVASN